MKSGYTISRSNTRLNKSDNVRATIVAVEKQYVLLVLREFVALGIQCMRMRRIVICDMSGAALFSHIIS